MKKFLIYFAIAVIFILVGWFANTAYHLPKASNPISQIKPTPLIKYSIENLSAATFKSSKIIIGEVLKDDPKFTSHKFTYTFSPDFSDNLKTISGLINIPKGVGPFPVIVMFRGYVDQKIYVTGTGTLRAGEFFAQNGYITIAPDFLGYGESDEEAENIFESRFQTYVTAVSLLKSVNTLPQWDLKHVFIWGHSNGGQIALTTLEILDTSYPTVLWAPVSKPFPYSILYYTDESDDRGRLIRSELSKFEETYDVEKFSLVNYLNTIKTSIQLHQGSNDDAVPIDWSNSLSKKLLELEVDLEYFKYSGGDHNMNPFWSIAIQRSLNFYNSHLTN